MKKNIILIVLFISSSIFSALFASLPTPTLSSPANNATNQYPNVSLSWSSVSGANRYEYRMSTNAQMQNPTVASTSNSYVSTSNLRFGITYYWQVRALKTSSPVDSSSWSTIRSFTVTNTPLTLSSPSNNAVNQMPNVTLNWNSISGINYYDYEVDITPNFNSPQLISGSKTSGYNYVQMSNLLFGTTYYWRVRARHTNDTLTWSTIRSFTVTNTPLTLTSPSNNAVNQMPNVTLNWNSISGITYYDYEVDITPNFNSSQLISGSKTSGYNYVQMSNLLFGTTYYWRIRARHAADILDWSNVWSFTVTNTPLTLSSPSNNAVNQMPNVTLNWNSISGINYYDYEVDITPNFNSPQLISGSKTSGYNYVQMSNLLFGTTYYWRVRARHTNDTLTWSTIRSFTITNTPLALTSPSNNAVNQMPNVTLNWNSISGITYYDYEVDITPNFNSPQLISGSRTSGYNYVQMSNLLFGTTYYWRIRARHAADILDWSNVWSFTVTNTPLTLSSPSNNAVNQMPNVTLNWNSISGINYYDYEVDITPNFNSPQLISGSKTSGYNYVQMANLLFGTTYYWRVRARHANDTLTWSTAWKFTTLPGPIILSSPSNGAINQAANVTLNWNSINGISYYDYQIDTSASFNSPLLISSHRTSGYNYVATSNLLFATTYYWRVRARHSADTMSWSNTWSFTTSLTQPTLSAPSNNAINQYSNVTLYWNSMNGVTYYDYEVDITPNFNTPQLISGSRTSGYNYVTMANLRFGQTYYWRVRARNSGDITPWSTTWKFTVLTGPITLSSPANGAVNQAANVTLNWNSINGINYYDYQVDTSSSFNSPLLISNSRTSGYNYITMANLLYGTKYYWRVRSRHAADTMPWSNTWNFTTSLTQPTLSAPSNNAINQYPDVTLRWNSMNGVTYYDYEVDITPNFNTPQLISGSRTSGYNYVSMTNLRFGQTYYWRVRARNSSDISSWSTVWNFTVLTGPIALSSPTDGAINQQADVSLNWNSINGINYYDYQWDITPNFNSPYLYSASRSSGYNYVSCANLKFGTTYYWRVRSRHAADTMAWSSSRKFTTLYSLTLSSPANGAINVNTTPTLRWNDINGINYYIYQCDITPSFNSNQLITGQRSSAYNYFALSNLTFGTTYYWRVRAYHSADTTQWSPVWDFTTAFQLTAVPNLISPANQSINVPCSGTTLSWTSATGATYYEIILADNPNFTNSTTLTTPSLSISTGALQCLTTYYWKVRGADNFGYTPWSTTWNFTTDGNQTPDTLNIPNLIAPQNFSTQNPWTGVLLVWDSVPNATFYEYQYADNVNFVNSTTGTTSAISYFTDTLQMNTTYYWKVRAGNGNDYSTWSTVWSFTTDSLIIILPPATPQLRSPADQSLNIPYTGVSLVWDSVSNSIFYEYQYADNINFANSTTGTTSAISYFTDTLQMNTTYYWKVRAGNGNDYSAWSTVWSFTTDSLIIILPPATPQLRSPADQSLNVPYTGVSLVWDSVPDAIFYEYQYADNINFANPTTGTTSAISYFTDTLQMNTTYYWQVRAGNGNDYSAWSTVWSFTTDSLITILPPATPQLRSPVDQSLNIPYTGVSLVWDSVPNATFYEYQYADNINFANSTTGTTSAISYFTDTLQMNTTYYWKVRAGNGNDYSAWSTVWSFTTDSLIIILLPATPQLRSPVDQSLNIPYTGVSLVWDSVPNAIFYEYQYADNINFANSITGTTSATSYFTDTLQMNTTYYWKVRAGNGNDYSHWSTVWSFTTDSLIIILPPATPQLRSPADQSLNIPYTGVLLVWDSVPNAIFYEYQYADNINFVNSITGTTSAISYFTDTLQMNTTYYWKVRAGNGNDYSVWSTVWSFTTDFISGIEYSSLSQVSLYPNPTTEQFTIYNGLGWGENVQLKIVDIIGREMLHINSPREDEIIIGTSTWKSGLYFIVIYNLQEKTTFSIIVNH